jgi:2-methylisocitrate lyase-like PEP mutase family enzyme
MAEIDVSALTQKAERLRALHHTGRILVLPNIWDPGGARMMESLGYPAVATASASIAYALGYDDGQQITLEAMLDVVGRVASSVHVPVTADMEWGYAEEPQDVAENMRRVLPAGAVGINLEDSVREGERLFEVEFQCARISAVRRPTLRRVPIASIPSSWAISGHSGGSMKRSRRRSTSSLRRLRPPCASWKRRVSPASAWDQG